MSTRKEAGTAKGVDASSILDRRHSLDPVRDKFMLSVRIYRNLLLEREATEKQWGEIAGLINVCGIYAQAQSKSPRKQLAHAAKAWWNELLEGALAMRDIANRNARVGGRWAATEKEAQAITAALNVADDHILRIMTATEFLKIATWLNEGKEDAP